jgi:hypothetical protein
MYANPLFDPAQAITGRATGAAVTGGRLVTVAAAKADGEPVPIKHCGASDTPIGVATADCLQNGTVAVHGSGTVLLCLSNAAIAAVGPVEVTAAGKVATLAAGTKVGVALHTTDSADDPVLVQLQL